MDVISVICEGSSEVNYIVRLKAYLDELDVAWTMDTLLVPINAGSGNFHVIEQRIRAERNRQRRGSFMTWVDYDIYQRNDNRCRDAYLRRRRDVKAFYQSHGNSRSPMADAGHRQSWLNTERLGKLTEDSFVDNAALKKLLGWSEMPIRAEDGMRETLKSFLNHEIH